MNSKTYIYKNLQFRLKDNDLELLRLAAPVLIKYRKLLHEYTKDIDLSEIEYYKSRVNELKTAIEQLLDKDNENDEKAKKINEKLNQVEKEFAENAELQSLMSLYTDCEGLVLLELISDMDFIKPFIKRILVGETDKLDFNDEEILKLIRDAVSDFFTITSRSRIISAA